MNALLPFVILGITAGSVYGLTGTGLVLTYKTAGIFNFAQGAVATTGAYTFYILHDDLLHLPAVPTALICVFVVGPVLGLGMEAMARRLADASATMKVVATIGLVLVVQGFFSATFGTLARTFPAWLPQHTVKVGGVFVGEDQMIITGIALAATVALFLFFRRTRLGLAMRGVVDNPELLDLGGTSPAAVRRWAWIIGSSFAVLAGILLAPTLNLDATVLTLLVVQAFGAAAIGRFSSLPLTYIGGLVIGIAASVATKYVVTSSAALAGLPASIPFIVLFLVLIFTPRSKLADRRVSRPRPAAVYAAPARVQIAGAVIVGAVLLIVPHLINSAQLPYWSDGMAQVILFLSLGLLVRTSGQVSLCQAAFAAIGATTMGHLTAGFGLPWGVALLLAGLAAVPVGAFITIPAIRLPGVFLALATFGFGVTMEQMGYPLWLMFGSSSLGQAVNRPSFAQGDIAYYYLVFAFAVLVSLMVMWLVRSRLGRLLRGMADSPVALATHGTSVMVTRVLVFCVSAFLAAISGALFGGVVHTVTSSDFTAFSSLTLLALLVIIPGREPWYAFGAGFALVIIPSWISTGATVSDWLNVLFGVAAVQVALGFTPRNERLHRFLDRIGGRRAPATASPAQEPPAAPGRPVPAAPGEATPVPAVTVAEENAPAAAAPVAANGAGAAAAQAANGAGAAVNGRSRVGRHRPPAAVGLDLAHVTVRYGGHIAVNDVSLAAPVGRITGLIGPNGAGKTTLFNVASGLVRPASGQLQLHGADMSALDPAARARHGLGRTFQKMELFDSLTARENVSLGREAGQAGRRPWQHVAETSRNRQSRSAAAERAMALAGVADLADRPVAALSTGQRRLVELARCLAGEFDVLLLDEPSSGLDGAETERFGEVLTRVVGERGVGILLVEHDMALVMNICDYVHVLDFGTKIFEGTTADVSASDTVRAAYLGTEPVGQPQPKMAR
jgi:ABC-type branched-subunit amino acid transport system ATPase component/branched-subunit amino acid ABC-type transport system permease component